MTLTVASWAKRHQLAIPIAILIVTALAFVTGPNLADGVLTVSAAVWTTLALVRWYRT